MRSHLRLVPSLGKQSYQIEAQIPNQKLNFTKALDNKRNNKVELPQNIQVNWVLVLFGNNITCFKIITIKYLNSDKWPFVA